MAIRRRSTNRTRRKPSSLRFGKYVPPKTPTPTAASLNGLSRIQRNKATGFANLTRKSNYQNAYRNSKSVADAQFRKDSYDPRSPNSTQSRNRRATTLQSALRRGTRAKNSLFFGGNKNRPILPGSPQDPNRPNPGTGNPDSLRYSSENPDLEKNIREDIRAGKHQESPFLQSLGKDFISYELANKDVPDAPYYSQVARAQDPNFGYRDPASIQVRSAKRFKSSIPDFDKKNYTPATQNALATLEGVDPSGYNFRSINENSIKNPLNPEGRDRHIRNVENNELENFFTQNVTAAKPYAVSTEGGGYRIEGTSGDPKLDAAIIAKIRLQRQPTPKFRGKNRKEAYQRWQAERKRQLEQINDQIGFAQYDLLQKTGNGNFLAELDTLRSVRMDQLVGRDRDLSTSRGQEENFGVVNFDTKISDIEKQQRQLYETNIADQKSSIEAEYNQKLQKAEADAKEKITKLKKQSDDFVEEQIRRAAANGQLPTDARGNYTRSALDVIAQIERKAAESLADDEALINRNLSDQKFQFDSARRTAARELDGKFADFQLQQLQGQATRQEKASTLAQKNQFALEKQANDQKFKEQTQKRTRLDQLSDFKEKELFKAQIKQSVANAGMNQKEVFKAFKDVASIKDPVVAKQALSVLASQLQQLGIEADIDDFAQIILSKQELAELNKQYLKAKIGSSNRSGRGRTSSSASSGGDSIDSLINQIAGGSDGSDFVGIMKEAAQSSGGISQEEALILQQMMQDPNAY